MTSTGRPTFTRSAIVKAEEPKVAARAARILIEELLQELKLNGFDPSRFDSEITITVRRHLERT
ncbi:hypothetical protein [Methylobacterium brachythecii]|uniref:Uncharacterized protein n=1 Tax=Methylobacterium brachythecii TaxID=1176177 RepID=A0A7W6F848_9HYPH|nr:hypothetical protein [Methylobacterium brachythecii]MBB3904117.1 hypothetical protein [Methylobacterium brachythecii]GLS42859.1 hypothetical protein GCM10007884_08440 [Methylobacterium brachythecii]